MEPIYPHEVLGLISSLRAFLTQESIDEAMSQLREREKNVGVVGPYKLQDLQPWLYAFDKFDRVTLQGQRNPAKGGPPRFCSLQWQVASSSEACRTMPEALRKHHTAALLNLDGQNASFVAEWSAADFYARRHNAQIEWLDAHSPSPEFKVRIGEITVKVECKCYGVRW